MVKKFLVSLPQLEWSCFLSSHIQSMLQLHFSEPIEFHLLEKNTMDSLTFPFVNGFDKIVNICNLENYYDCVVNVDSDPLVSNFLSEKYKNVLHMHQCMYNLSELSIWESFAKALDVDCCMPIFKLSFETKSKSDRADWGVAIKDDGLRMYVKDYFFKENSRLWHLPVRQNLLKRFDECSTVRSIVTDDIFCALSSFHMDKEVIFLKVNSFITNISVSNKIHVQDISGFNKNNEICN